MEDNKMSKATLLADYALKGVSFLGKRAFTRTPDRIETVVVDLDYTLLDTLTAYRALEKLLGAEGAKAAYREQKERVKSGKANFADVKYWGHLQQLAKGWTDRDWKNVLDEAIRDGKLNHSLIDGLRAIKGARPDIKVVLTTGTSSVIGSRLAAYLRKYAGVKIDLVVGSTQHFATRERIGFRNDGPRVGRAVYGDRRRLTGLGRFVGETHNVVPTIEKIPAIREAFGERGLSFNVKTTMAISDADPELLRHCGIGVLIPVSKSEDPASYVSQKFKLRDVESRHGGVRAEFIKALALNPKEAVKKAQQTIKTAEGKIDALTHHLMTKPGEPLPLAKPRKPSMVARMFKRK